MNGIKLGRVLIGHLFIPALDIRAKISCLFLLGKLTDDIARKVINIQSPGGCL